MSFKNVNIFKVGALLSEYLTQQHPRGHIGHVMSTSPLKEFGHCPNRWIAGYESSDTKSKEWGSLIDCLTTSPDEFKHRFAVRPEKYKAADGSMKDWSGSSTFCKKWKADRISEGMIIISKKTQILASQAVLRLSGDTTIKAWFEASQYQVWIKGEWHDPDTGLVIPVQCLIDFVPGLESEFPKSLGDLKCVRSCGLIPFQRQVYQMGWHIQAAFNMDLYVNATKEDRCNWCFIIQENFEPFEPAKRILAEAYIEIGRATYRRLLKNYCQCLKNGKWPAYDEHDESIQGWSLVQPEPWMESADTFAPKYEFEEEENGEEDEPPDDIPT